MDKQHAVAAVGALVLLSLAVGLAAGGLTTLIDNGPSANRVDMVFLGDGYTASDIAGGVYDTHISKMLYHMFDEGEDPFPRYRNFFNVHRVEVVSNQSGADVPPLGIYRDTALDATYYYDGVTDRLLYISTTKANTYLSNALSGAGFSAEMKLVTVNDTRYGGGGGTYATYAGGNSSAPEVALHELGHSFANLADEYQYSTRTYSGPEPTHPNATINTNPNTSKWAAWIGYTDPAHPGIGPVGFYEGSDGFSAGVYRPTSTSKMRALGQPFNAISREALILRIYDRVDPLDAWLDNSQPLANPLSLWVDTVDPAVIDVSWAVNGEAIDFQGEQLWLGNLGLEPGRHVVSALAQDSTIGDWVRTSTDALRQTVQWVIDLTVPVPTDGDANNDGTVDDCDLSVLLANWGRTQHVTWYEGDFNGDGKVDDADLSRLLSKWGQGSSVVPEPALTALLLPLLALRRRRR